MKIRFTACETVSLPVEDEYIPIHHYLRQPQRLVKALSEPKLMEQLGSDRYRLKVRPFNLLDLYYIQPTVVLKVWADPQGTVYLKSESCQIRGIEYIDTRFSLNVKGLLSPISKNGKTYLQGQADLEINIELPPLLLFTPMPLLEAAGNGIVKGVLLRIKQRLLSHLLSDYHQWAAQEQEQKITPNFGSLAPIEN